MAKMDRKKPGTVLILQAFYLGECQRASVSEITNLQKELAEG